MVFIYLFSCHWISVPFEFNPSSGLIAAYTDYYPVLCVVVAHVDSFPLCVSEVGVRLVQVQTQGGAGVLPFSQLQELLPQFQLSVGAAAAGVSSAAW